MTRLPLRFLTSASVAGLSLLTAAAPAPAQIGPATAEGSDAPEPRFGMFRDPAGYEGADPDHVDYNGELIALDGGELTLSLLPGIDGSEALQAAVSDGPAERNSGTVDDRDDDRLGAAPGGEAGAAGAPGAATGDRPAANRQSYKLDKNVPVYLNGRKVDMEDLRPGDRIRIRRGDGDKSPIRRVIALRTADFGGYEPGGAPVDPTDFEPAKMDPSVARAARTGVTSPGGGGFQNVTPGEVTGESKENLEDRGVTVGGGNPVGMPAGGEGEKAAPGFGVAVADSPGEGVLVADVQPGGPAAEAGVQRGDFLTRLDGKTVQTPEDLKTMAKDMLAAEGDPPPVEANLWRDGEQMTVEIAPSNEASDYFEKTAGRALSMGAPMPAGQGGGGQGGDPQGQRMSLQDSGDSGIEVLAGAAVGALAAEAGSEAGGVAPAAAAPMMPRTSYYGGLAAGANFVNSGFSPLAGTALAGYGGYYGGTGYGLAAAARNPYLDDEKDAIIEARMREAAVRDAIGHDAEDYVVGQRATPLDSRGPKGDGGGGDRLMPGDRIVGVNGHPVGDQADLERAMRNFKGDVLSLNVIRGGERQTLRLPRREAATAAQ